MNRISTSTLTKTVLAMLATLVSFQGIAAEAVSGVYVNGQPVDEQQLRLLDQRFGLRLPQGRYWYDPQSGLVGPEHAAPIAGIAPGLTLFSPNDSQGADAAAASSGTGVLVNGRSISEEQLGLLEQIFGPVPPGQYWFVNQAPGQAAAVPGSMPPGAGQPAWSPGYAGQYPGAIPGQAGPAGMPADDPDATANALGELLGIMMLGEFMRQAAGTAPDPWGYGMQSGYPDGNSEAYPGAWGGGGQQTESGDWSYSSDVGDYSVGGTGDGCIYTPDWSNC